MRRTEELAARALRVPGEPGVWIFILGDMLVFAVLFGVYLYYRDLDVATFRAGSAQTDPVLGTLNTLLLLTSSWFVACAVKLTRTAEASRATGFLAGGIGCGTAFAGVKALEYSAKVEAGFTIQTDYFFMLYYFLTGVHMLHVLVGIAVLSFLLNRSRQPIETEDDRRVFESGGAYWHMVDLLWIVLFALLYLVA